MNALPESEKNRFFIRSGIATLPSSKSFYKVLWIDPFTRLMPVLGLGHRTQIAAKPAPQLFIHQV